MTHDEKTLLRNNIEGVLRRCTLKSSGTTTDEVLKVISVALAAKDAEIARLRSGAAKSDDDICQILGKALGYPWFKDDQKNFPGATEDHGVYVGEHVAETLAEEAARKIAALRAQVERMKRAIVDIVPEDDVTDSDEVEIGPVRRRKYWRNLAAAAEKEPQS